MDIIVKQFSNILGVKPASNIILMGDIRDEIARDVFRQVEKSINKHQKKERYWMLIHSKPDPMRHQTILTKVIITKYRPRKMLGTMCFMVDNKAGRVEKEWILPYDKPYRTVDTSKEPVQSIIDDAKDIKIKW